MDIDIGIGIDIGIDIDIDIDTYIHTQVCLEGIQPYNMKNRDIY